MGKRFTHNERIMKNPQDKSVVLGDCFSIEIISKSRVDVNLTRI